MFVRRLFATAALIGLMAAPVLAQIPAPASPSVPVVTAPAVPSAAVPATGTPHPAVPTASAVAPVAGKTNLNTATKAELDALPFVGKSRARVILKERAKSPFKDWADFDKRTTGTSVTASVKSKIAPLVTF